MHHFKYHYTGIKIWTHDLNLLITNSFNFLYHFTLMWTWLMTTHLLNKYVLSTRKEMGNLMNNNIRTNKMLYYYFPNLLFQMQNKLRSNTWFGDYMCINSSISQDLLIKSVQFWFKFVKNFQTAAITCLLLWIILVPEIKPAIPLPGPEPKPKPEPGKKTYLRYQQNIPFMLHYK